jgi:hypothetical protein
MTNEDRPSIISGDDEISSWDGWNYLSQDQWENLERANVLELLTSLIEHDGLRAFAIYILSMSHPKFWMMPASSTGKHHPKHEQEPMEIKEGLVIEGLMKHIWMVMTFAMDGLRRYGYDSKRIGSLPTPRARKRDIVAFSVLLHDWARNGNPVEGKWGQYTDKKHGEMAADIIENQLLPVFLDKFPEAPEHEWIREAVSEASFAIHHHYAAWSSDGWLPRDSRLTEVASLLSESDFYSSRHFIGEPDRDRMLEVLKSCGPLYWKRIP